MEVMEVETDMECRSENDRKWRILERKRERIETVFREIMETDCRNLGDDE